MPRPHHHLLTLVLGLIVIAAPACGDDSDGGTPPANNGGNNATNNGGNNATNNGGNNATNNGSNNATNNGTNNPTNNGTNDACTPEAPVCPGAGPNQGCAAGEVCNADCACEPQGCVAADPVCPGNGPNNGCSADELCNTDCACEPRPCFADAPVCGGAGPNNGCDADQFCDTTCLCRPNPIVNTDFLTRPSRSTAIDTTADDQLAVMVNTDDGSVSVFDMTFGSEARTSRVPTSASVSASEPVAVVIHPDGERAYVANRATGTVAVIDRLSSAPRLMEEIYRGAEPMGLALTPSGALLFVTDWVAGTVTVIDTQTLRTTETLDVGGNPFAIVITNDGDEDDDDEKALVTEFYGQARAAAANAEGTDDGKEGIVHVIGVASLRHEGDITLAPIASCFTNDFGTSGCYPNQLYGITVHTAFDKTRAYVTSVAAAPGGPVNFAHNYQAVVHVIDVDTEQELPALTTNLNTLVKGQVDMDGDTNQGRRFVNVPVGIDFVPRPNVAFAYVASSGSDMVVRVEFTEDDQVHIGSPIRLNIPVGQSPQGIVVKNGRTNAGAYVANLITRDVSVVDFADQVEVKRVMSTTQPTANSAEFPAWRGKRFFNTSTGIWSMEGWGSCQSCHPQGLTDNVTFKFAAGPRQSISLDGQYASGDPGDMRALNWTAIFDETHDFELNTRGVSGGAGTLQNASGRITSSAGSPPFAAINVSGTDTIENHQALNGSLTFIANDPSTCTNANTCPDFNFVDAYIQTIRSPRGKPAPASVLTDGRALFEEGGCDKCHGGPKWTISRTFYSPETFTGELGARVFATNAAASTAMDPTALTSLPANTNTDTTLVAGDDSDGGTPALKRIACNIRSVGTFGLDGGAEETRENNTPAQGRKGFNPPSLLGLSTGAPYLHNGAAATLDDLFSSRFAAHTTAGNPNFRPLPDEVDALVAFLLSIDETTDAFEIAPNTLLCPVE